MILRRVIEHFRKQEWTAIAIDFVIVVVGVFVGLQVNNWNEARADRAKAQGFLSRIVNDLAADVATYEDRMTFWRSVAGFGAKALDYAETGDAKGASQWELLIAYFQASQVAEFFTTDATYDELKSAGELRLIADTGLRSSLAQYYSLGVNPALTERPRYREQVRGRIPLAVQNYIWANCYESDYLARQAMRACSAPIDEAESAKIVDALRSDAALMEDLRYWMSTMEIASRIGFDRSEAAARLKAAVDAKLGAAQ